jgi:hypothetical protein
MAFAGVGRRCVLVVLSVAVAVLGLAGCGSGTGHDHAHMSGATSGTAASTDIFPSGDGLADNVAGFTLVSASRTVPGGQPASLSFRITGPSGQTVTWFEPNQTKLMHLYLVRSDLTGFQHVYPDMAPDGTWTASVAALQPGIYRVCTQFTARAANSNPVSTVLGVRIAVPGEPSPLPLPSPADTTQVDGYAVTVQGNPMVDMSHDLTVTVTRNDHPVTDLQPHLDSYAQLTAFHEGDLAHAHLHPHDQVTGNQGGPTLSFDVSLPSPGNWRLFVQFRTGGTVHTAALTLLATY